MYESLDNLGDLALEFKTMCYIPSFESTVKHYCSDVDENTEKWMRTRRLRDIIYSGDTRSHHKEGP